MEMNIVWWRPVWWLVWCWIQEDLACNSMEQMDTEDDDSDVDWENSSEISDLSDSDDENGTLPSNIVR